MAKRVKQVQSIDEVPEQMFFRIGETADLVGVETHVLRYWEGEFKLRPQRSSSGQRKYKRVDVAKFLRIRRLLHDDGFTIAGANRILHTPNDDGAKVVVEETISVLSARLQAVRRRVQALALEVQSAD